MKRFAISILACAVFVLIPSVSGNALPADPDPYAAEAEFEPQPTVGEPERTPQPPARTVVPSHPDPDLPDNGVTWITVTPTEPMPSPVVEEPPQVAVSIAPQVEFGDRDVSIRLVVAVGGEEHVIELPSVTVDAMVQALAPAASTPAPVAPVPSPVVLTPAPPVPAVVLPSGRTTVVVYPRNYIPAPHGVYRVQVGTFARTGLARNCFDRLRSAGFSAAFERFGDMYRVVISGVRAAEMPAVAQRLGDAGFEAIWIRREN